jgi:hypothetical protein
MKRSFFENNKRYRTRLALLVLCLILACSDLSAVIYADDEEGPSLQERIQEIQKEIRTEKVGQYGMIPISGRDVEDGEYTVVVESSSPFFRIIDAKLKVKGDQMTADITISSLSYQWVYPGRAEQADADTEDHFTGYREDDGHGVFTIDVEALNKPIPCAAYSKKRKRWYDRDILFVASSLPEGALKVDLPDYEAIETALKAYEVKNLEELVSRPHKIPEPVSVPRSDGEYSIEVNMTGGSGRASISSPTLMTVRDGKAYATLIWSSTYYDYMILEEEYYFNLTEDGGPSRFEIPITAMDTPIPVTADTTAMGDPVEIHYELTFYEESIGEKGQIPQEAAKKVLMIAAAIIVFGGIANYFVKKKRTA